MQIFKEFYLDSFLNLRSAWQDRRFFHIFFQSSSPVRLRRLLHRLFIVRTDLIRPPATFSLSRRRIFVVFTIYLSENDFCLSLPFPLSFLKERG
jgi:hypothetical protein